MSRKRHLNKDVESVIQYAEAKKWTIETAGKSSHAWGKMKCPANQKDCRCGNFCIVSIWSTPRNSGNHAKQLKKVVDNCIYPIEE